MILVAALTVAMLGIGSLAINIAYVELSRTQIRTTADAAAKAALVTLSETQSRAQARQAARSVGRQNTVLGNQLAIPNSDIRFGSAVEVDGKYTFVNNGRPLNSVQLTVRFGDGSNNSAASTLFSSFVGTGSFSGDETAIAGRYDHDVIVVVDRSGSMAWDDSGVDFAYPGDQAGDSTVQNYFRPPHATGSRWAALVEALEVFDGVLGERDLNPQVGLVSYSSDYTFGVYDSEEVTLEQPLTTETSLVLEAAVRIGDGVLVGDTNIASGLREGRRALLDRNLRRITATRTIILLSDGVATEGGDAVVVAQTCVNPRIKIHTISFSDGADQDEMLAIADTTGGKHFHAPTAEQLREAFRRIAEELPATLTF
ncbi:MAG: vWA domain-containing protein [Planctomycetota bacterium]